MEGFSITTPKGSIELAPGEGRCIVEGCKMMGGNKLRLTVHHVDYDKPVRFVVCGRCFSLGMGEMMQAAESLARTA